MLQNPFNAFQNTHSQPLTLSLSRVPSITNNIITIHTPTGNSEKGKREERMATGAVEMMLRCVFDGCLSMQDMEIERRPYHRNCSCQLHNSKGVSSNACPHQRNIPFPMKHSWTSCSLSIAAPNSSPCSFQGGLSNRNIEDTSRLEDKVRN